MEEKVVMVDPGLLIPNSLKSELYSVPGNFMEIKVSIKLLGVIEPLLVNRKTNVIISGNLRHQIATELGIPAIPVIFSDVDEIEMDIKSISTNQQRVKSTIDILKEIEFFEKEFNIKKGQRTDLNSGLKEIKEKRDAFLKEYSRTTRENIKKIGSLAEELFQKDTEDYKGVFKAIDSGRATLHGMCQHLTDKKNRMHNLQVIPPKFELQRDHVKIYNHSSDNMYELEDESIDAIITSPPYFRMKDYGNGENELGQEVQVELYLLNMMKVFKECYRVLKSDGSLFVNLNDCVLGGEYKAVPHYFVISMLKMGWKLNDELLWIKNNPTYTRGKRSVRSHEPIFHFVKSVEFYYNDNWLKEIEDSDSKMSYGTKKSSPKVKSAIDYRDGVLVTNVSSTKELKKAAKENGFNLTHSATFPLAVPAICGLLSTQKGDTILDCFTGESTTGKFTLEFDRNFVGYDVKPEFVMGSEVNLRSILQYVDNGNIHHRLQREYLLRKPNFWEDFRFDLSILTEEELSSWRNKPELSNAFKGFTKVFHKGMVGKL